MNSTHFDRWPRPSCCQNQIQSRGYRSHNRNGYRPAKPLQLDRYFLCTISPVARVLLRSQMEKEILLKHVALECNNKNNTELFFTKILGLDFKKKIDISESLSEIIFGIKQPVEIFVYENNKLRFEVFINKRILKNSYNHVCLEIKDIDEFLNRCMEFKVEIIKTQKNGKNLLFIRDFSGNLFEIK